jgi:hypothetical protein
MKNIQACMGPMTYLDIRPVNTSFRAVLWAVEVSGLADSQWSVGHGPTAEAALADLDSRLTGLTYDDVMRS